MRPEPARGGPPPSPPRWVRWLGRPVLGRWLRVASDGAARVPTTGGVILAPTHGSHADVVALSLATERRLTYLGSAHLAAIPLAGRLLRWLGLVVIRRGAADAGALNRCVELLRRDAALVVFPEGGRSRDGRVYRPRSGVARLAATAGCPVVPVAIVGTSVAWPPGALPRPGGSRVLVRFGAPLAAPAATPRDRRAFNQQLHAAMVGLSGAEDAGEMMPRSA